MKKILAALVTAIVAAIGVIVTPKVVAWASIFLGLGLLGMFTGWGCTEGHKRVWIYPRQPITIGGRDITQREFWDTEIGKRKIVAWAWFYGTLWTALEGAVFYLLFEPGSLELKQKLAVGVLWFIWSMFIGAASPPAYKFTIKYLFPLLVKRVSPAPEPCPAPVEGVDGEDRTLITDRREQ